MLAGERKPAEAITVGPALVVNKDGEECVCYSMLTDNVSVLTRPSPLAETVGCTVSI